MGSKNWIAIIQKLLNAISLCLRENITCFYEWWSPQEICESTSRIFLLENIEKKQIKEKNVDID